ncbi:MAG: ribosome biogenesis GTPase YlqF [Gammaproteobacteria bacterium]|nr:ribosome biogenesis GTPase YlqF [Gammaproteobacteria bacterium]
MSISWYPGHMHKARKELAKAMLNTNVVIDVLDARIPQASSNPLLAELRGDIPCLRILNKSDLANPEITRQWCKFLSQGPDNLCLVNGRDCFLSKESILRGCRQLIKGKATAVKKHQVLITGIPNVGKSTLLNQILCRKVAKTGNEPTVTKRQQRVKLDDDWYLIDSPGMLWPKLEDQQAAYRLASTGTIRNTAVEAEDIAWFTAETLLQDFFPCLQKRYELSQKPENVESFLEEIAIKNGCLGRGRAVDWNKVSELLLNDFRSGRLGRISLESPPATNPHSGTSE